MIHPNMYIVYYFILSSSSKIDIRYLLNTNKINYRKPDEYINGHIFFFFKHCKFYGFYDNLCIKKMLYVPQNKKKNRDTCRARLFAIVYYTVFANKLLSCKSKEICIFQTIKIVYLFHPTYHNSQSIKQTRRTC